MIETAEEGYIGFMRAKVLEEENSEIRYSTRTGRPYGSEGFITKMENKLDRTFRLGLPGRPRKKAGREKK